MIKIHMKDKKRVLFIVLLVLLPLLLIINPDIQAEADIAIEIDSIEDLWNIRNNLSGYYILMKDLDFQDDESYDNTVHKSGNTTGSGWLPIGSENYEFTGTFDGKNYTISNLFIDRDDEDGIGLFGYTWNSTIININLIDVDVTGYEFVGGLIGFNMGTISNCSITGGLYGYYYVGGLVGYNLECSISDSYAAVHVQGENNIGGLTGGNIDSSVYTSYANGDVTGLTDYDNNMGGLIGYNEGNITNCYANGDIVSEGEYSWYIGGLVGENSGGSIANCYSTGLVYGNDIVGGLIGSNTGIVKNCFWDEQTSGQDSSDGGTSKTTSEMKNFNTFNDAGWDIAIIEDYIDETWFINHIFDYPHLGWEPTSEPNNPPNLPFNPNPSNHNTSVDINAELIWLGGDPDSGDAVTYDIYFGINTPPKVISNQSSNTYDPGTMEYNTKYYWKIVAWDNHGLSTIGTLWDFITTIYVNYPPNTPFNPTPQNDTTNVNINQDLYWSGSDPNDDDTVTYDIYFGTNSTPIKIVSNQSTTSYDPGTMNYNTKYYWRIIAWDNSSEFSTGSIWSFTTGSQSQGGNGGGGGSGGPILLPNIIPIADASASDSYGFINTPITFNASYSVDEDGEITNYIWDFGDGSSGYGIIITHIYAEAGVYNVKLTVTDNNNVSDTDSFEVIIGLSSNLPTIPQIDGPNTGKQNIEYNFSVFSTSYDNDNIQYFFNWGDGETDETDFLANGTTYVQKHKWTTAGIFKIRVYAVDSKYAVSASAYFNILIDVIYCRNLGYLIDENSDGTYDLFYSNKTETETITQQQDDGSYLLNYDEDSDWDYIYDSQNNTYSAYSEASAEIFKDGNIWLFAFIIIVILAILVVVILKRKKPSEVIEKQKTEEPQVEEPMVEEQKIEEPKPEALKTEEPVGPQPEAVVSKVEEPVTEEELVEEPKTMEQKIEELISEKEKVGEPTIEEEKTEEIKTEEPQMEKPEIEEEKTEEQMGEEQKPEEPEVKETEEIKTEESKVEEQKTEETKTEEEKAVEEEVEEEKTEDQKAEEQETKESEMEEQKTEESKTEEPEVKEPEETKTEEEKAVEEEVEEEKTEESKQEEQKPEEPEVKETEEIKTEESKVEEQKTGEEKAEEEKEVEEEKTEDQKAEEQETKESEMEEQKTEESKTEEPEVKESEPEETVESKVEEKETGESKQEEQKPEEIETIEPEAVESKQEEPKTEEPKSEEQKTEEEKAEESKVKKPKPSETEDEEQKT